MGPTFQWETNSERVTQALGRWVWVPGAGLWEGENRAGRLKGWGRSVPARGDGREVSQQ